MGISLDSPITALRGIGKERSRAFAKLGISCVSDLLYHFPRAYEHRGNVKLLANAENGEVCSFILTVATEPVLRTVRRGMTLVKFRAFDDSGTAHITFFNQPFVRDVFKMGKVFRFYGKLVREGRTNYLSAPAYEPYKEGEPLPDLVPIYPMTEGLSRKIVELSVSKALDYTISQIEDPLPSHIREGHQLCVLSYAIRQIHRPDSFETLSVAVRRLVFDEYFTFSLGIMLSAAGRTRSRAPVCINTDL